MLTAVMAINTSDMKKLSKYELSKVSKNLDTYFNMATEDEINHGMRWYVEANNFCVDAASIFGVDSLVVASVVSALSPRNKWATNLKDTITVLQAVANGLTANDVKVSTFHTNKFKAFALANGLTDITNDSRKTYSFVRNVGLLDDNRVTVDVWHLRACFNRTIEAGVGKIAYDQLEKLTISKAKKLGLKGYEYQAIIWASIQNNF
jgi:hypothetical protein